MAPYEFTVYKGSKNGDVVKSSTRKEGPVRDQVLVSITHSGLCGTDIHYQNVDMVLGHEGVGIVAEVGPDVQDLKRGDRVGWGYLHDSCMRCQQCLSGRETFCPNRHIYGTHELDQGSFGTQAIWRESFLFKVPDKMTSEAAAPLMCGGATVFNVLEMYNVRPTDRVGIIGVGGLGHLAIQFASKMGCQVVVFSGTESKKEEAMKLGAKEFYATKGLTELKLEGGPIDHLLLTASSQPDWSLYLPIMAPGGTIYPLAVSSDNLSLPYMQVLSNGIRIQGSLVAARHIHKKMLDFAAYHDIKPILMKWPLNENGIRDAIKTLNDGKMRYRGCLVADESTH